MATQNRTSVTTHPADTTTARTVSSFSLPAKRLRKPDSGLARCAGDNLWVDGVKKEEEKQNIAVV